MDKARNLFRNPGLIRRQLVYRRFKWRGIAVNPFHGRGYVNATTKIEPGFETQSIFKRLHTYKNKFENQALNRRLFMFRATLMKYCQCCFLKLKSSHHCL
jgi:hypothetical protein